MNTIKSPEADRHPYPDKDYAQRNAAEQRGPVREHINSYLQPFMEADSQTPETEHPQMPINEVQTDNPLTYDKQDEGRDKKITQTRMQATWMQRNPGAKRAPKRRLSDPKPVFDDSNLAAYAEWRSGNASSLGEAFLEWDKIRGDTGADVRWLLSHAGKTAEEAGISEPETTTDDASYFNNVHTVDMAPYGLGSDAFKLIVLPTFAQKEKGETLMQATAQAVWRVTDIAKSPIIEEVLSQIDHDEAKVRRASDGGGNPEEQKKQAGKAMLTEAVMTTAQSASLLLADIKTPFNLGDAIESLDRNGAFMLLRLLPAGVIGPMAGNGTRWDPDYALDQEKLAEGEFALSEEFRTKLLASHTESIIRRFGSGALYQTLKTGEEAGIAAPGAGCPASLQHMRFAAGLLKRELQRAEEDEPLAA